MAVLELVMWGGADFECLRLQPSPPDARMTGLCPQDRFMGCWGLNPRLHMALGALCQLSSISNRD